MKLEFRNHHEMYLYLDDLGFKDCYYDSNYDWCVNIINSKDEEIIVTSAGCMIKNGKYFDDIECFNEDEFEELIK